MDGRSEQSDLTSTVEGFRSVVAANADGELTERMDETVENDVLAALACEYNSMIDAWSERFESVDEFGSQVVTATEQVTDRVDQAQETSREVNQDVEEIADGAVEQNEYIQDVSGEMRNLSATIEEIAASADQVVAATDRAVAKGESGQDAAADALTELDELEDVTARTVENVERLEELMDEIRDVATLIDEIAQETSMLALNANIEAARAGESGDGFAVVANEVKTLAEETQEATDEIEATIETVRDQAGATVTDIHTTRECVHTTAETVDDSLTALEEIVTEVKGVQRGIREISEATDAQAESTEEAASMVNEVGTISEETAAEADTVATAAQQQTTTLTEIRTSVTTLSERADDLQSLLSGLETTERQSAGGVRGATDATEVTFWHAMSGETALLLNDLAREFEEQSNRDITISLESKGSYRGALNASIRAVETGNPPAISQIAEIGTKRAMDSDGFVPIERFLSDDVVDVDALLDPVVNYYRTDGQLYSMPFNSSNPICCYNADAFAAAGLDPSEPPETFGAVRDAAERLVSSGVTEYGVTFANYSWFVEQWFAEQNQELVNTRNGRNGTADHAYIDTDAARRIFDWWAGMDGDGLYYNPGIEARGEAKEAFHGERAAILIGSTSSLSGIESGAREAGFEVRTGYFPVPANVDRHGVLVGGASLWLADDVPREIQTAAAEFIGWLAAPEQQIRWHKETGYLPTHRRAVSRLRRDGWFDENPHFETAVDQLRETRDTAATRGARIGPFGTVRTQIAEGYEAMSDGQPVDEAVDRLATNVDRQLEVYKDES